MPLTSARVATSRGARNDQLLEAPQLPIAGVIRAGIQTMTAEAAKVPELRAIYEQGVEAGVSFKDILARGQAHPKCPQRNGRPLWWLRPSNAPFFVARQADFPGIPGAADRIMADHAEVREGDPEPRLYSFPVVFPTDILDVVFREEFSEYNSSGERVHWSQMSTDGVLKCVQYAPLRAEGRSARKRFDSRRLTEIRCDCDPDACEFFGAGKCAHYGSLFFWIPGIQSEGVIRLTFKSVYTKLSVYDTLTRIHDQVLGRIAGLYEGKPIFRISKRRQTVPRVNREKGTTERSDQWIVHLSAPGVNIIEALSGRGEQAMLSAPESEAIAQLEPPPPMMDDDIMPEPEPEPEPEPGHAPTAEVKKLRAELNKQRKDRDWSDEDFADWVEAQNPGIDVSAAMRDEERLRAMIDAISGLPPLDQQQQPENTTEELPL